MTATGGLEESYRRLLRWYPPVYRRRHEEEILGVLMAAAQPGQHRPSAHESLDLLWWGLKVRFRIVLRGESQPWASAFSLVSVLFPLLIVLYKLTECLDLGARQGFGTPADVLIGAYGDPGRYTWSFQLNPYSVAVTGNVTGGLTAGPGPALILAVLALIGWRRAAAVFAMLVPLAYVGVSLSGGYTLLGGPYPDFMLYAYGLEALVLLAAPDAPRGWRALRWRPSALLAIATAAGGIATCSGLSPLLPHPFHGFSFRPGQFRLFRPQHGFVHFIDRLLGVGPASGWGDWLLYQGTLVAVIVVALLATLLSSPANRRALALIAVPFAPAAVIYLCSLTNVSGLTGDLLAVLPLMLLILLAVTAGSPVPWRPASPGSPGRPATP